jgi:hypothetical protein
VVEGHPFLTSLLDEVRAVQRRRLREIPDWVLDDCGDLYEGLPPSPENAIDRAVVETELREQAALAMTAMPHAEAFRADFATGALGSWVTLGMFDVAPHSVQAKFAERARVAWADHRFASLGPDHAAEMEAIKLFAMLAAWADTLAGDYCDPRIAEKEHTSRRES